MKVLSLLQFILQWLEARGQDRLFKHTVVSNKWLYCLGLHDRFHGLNEVRKMFKRWGNFNRLGRFIDTERTKNYDWGT